jgi:hypothetical protein
MTTFSVIMPVYNVEQFVAEAVESVLNQTYEDFELIIVNDLGQDSSIEICQSFSDNRIRFVHHQQNEGLAGARNSGVRAAKGQYLAFLDSDDCWHPEKLSMHLQHFEKDALVGLSYSRSAFIDEQSKPMNCYQMPPLIDISPEVIMCRNPVGNGSAPVIRREVFEAISYKKQSQFGERDCFFDDDFRRSEDVECWLRISLTTDWKVEGIPDVLTLYRVNTGGLSANLQQQFESWEKLVEKTRTYAPLFTKHHEHLARAYQLRYLARQGIRLFDGKVAFQFFNKALKEDWRIVKQEPIRSALTAVAVVFLRAAPNTFKNMYSSCAALIGRVQKLVISRDLALR